MSNEIGLGWLNEVFLPETETLTPPALEHDRSSVLDGHASHVNVEFIWACLQNKVYCIYLP